MGLRVQVQAKLDVEWRPEQIAAHLRSVFPDEAGWHVCHETIYQALHKGSRGGLSRRLTQRLRTGRPLRKRRRRPDGRRIRFVVAHQGIVARPAIVETRTRVGDGEGDLVVGQMSRSALAPLVDRWSGFLQLMHLPGGHRADQLLAAPNTAMVTIPERLRLTLTWDQGSEMASHDQVGLLFREGVFFADPGSPWMRGMNENANGLVCQYLPKGTNLNVHDADDLAAIEAKLNNRPRKRLGWKTPAEVFAGAR